DGFGRGASQAPIENRQTVLAHARGTRRGSAICGVATSRIPSPGAFGMGRLRRPARFPEVDGGIAGVCGPFRLWPHARAVRRAVRQTARRDRSEERRVGKECSSRWSPDNEKKKNKISDRTS